MDDYEVYAGKGMVIVNATYMRHTYTWSDHSITGEKLGWGITASSTPDDSRLLRELEKLASTAIPDYKSRIPVEMLLYSPICGYVKMTAMARRGDNAGRKNKMVRLFQMTGSPVTPAAYLAPGDSWDPPRKGNELAPMNLEVPIWERSVCVEEIGGPDVIREIMALAYRTVTGDIRQLNLLAPDWGQEEFAYRSRYIMYLIHEMLPENLRKKAGYISFARERVRRIPFVFSRRPLGENVFTIGGPDRMSPMVRESVISLQEDQALLDAFFTGLSHDYLENPESFDHFLKAAAFLDGKSGSRSQLVRLAYLYLGQPEHEELIPPLSLIQEDIPDLLYWAASDEKYSDLAAGILDVLHREIPDKSQAVLYIRTLAAGCTKRNMEQTASELRWLIHETGRSSREIESLYRELEKESEVLYDRLTGSKGGKSPKGGHADKNYANKDHADKNHTNRNQSNKNQSNKDSANIAFENKDSANDKKAGKEAGRGRKKMKSGRETGPDPETRILEEVTAAATEPIKDRKNAFRTAEVRTVEDGVEESLTFLITGIVQGFVTGCMLYLARYTMKLGRWKIALGLLGIWIPIMVNYWYILRQKGEWRPLWKIWGLCLVEGFVIEAAAWFFPTQKMRLTFFVILGVLVLLVQLLGILRLFTKNRKR